MNVSSGANSFADRRRSPSRRPSTAGVLALDRHVGGHPVVAKAAPDQARHLHLVFDDQDSHRSTVVAEDESQMSVLGRR